MLDSDFVADFHRLERDLRQIDAEDMKKAIEALGIFKKIFILHCKDISSIKIEGEIVMPDEDITRELKERYFGGLDVKYDSIFLRWEKQISATEAIVPPDRVVSTMQFDNKMIRVATEAARKSSDWWRQVGAALVKDGDLILVGYNRHMPSDMSMDVYGDPRSSFDAGIRIDLSTAIHGEASVIARAAREGIRLDGTSIYVTTFPCPACAKLICDAGIKKVFYAKGYSMLDAENILKSANIEIILVQEK